MVDEHNKILIIRLSSIGDVLLSTPFVRQVRNQFRNAEIDYIIKDIFQDLIQFNPHINTVFPLHLNAGDKALKKLKHQLKNRSYDIIFDLHNNFRSNYLRRGINAKDSRSIKKNKIRQTILVYLKKNFYNDIIPIPKRYLKVAEDFDISDDGKGLELYWNDETKMSTEKKAQKVDHDFSEPYLCLAPGAGFYTKRWPAENFEQLIGLIRKEFNYQVVLLGGEEDIELGRFLGTKNSVHDFTGKLTLLETGVILSKGKALVSNDTGLMHMATAVDTPVLAIFGSTVQEFGFFPFRGKSLVLENAELSCRPCTHIGRKRCPKSHFDCMLEISTEDVFENLKVFLMDGKPE
jgi:heptosyltransferase-2